MGKIVNADALRDEGDALITWLDTRKLTIGEAEFLLREVAETLSHRGFLSRGGNKDDKLQP